MTSTRTAIITGGASGIGLAISERSAADGAAVAIFDLNGEAAEAAAGKIEAAGGTAMGLAVDVTDRDSIDAAVAHVKTRLAAPTILVNSAGMTGFDPFLEIPLEKWNRILEVNLTGTFNCCQVVIPHMLEAGWGRIVNISSSSVHSGSARMTHYVAAKSGVVGLTKALALEFASRGITVNTIPPGFIDTPMLRGAAADGSVNIERSIGTTPVGRVGRPEDIAAACAFLVSEEAGYITGQVIGVNGGRNT
jgi:NAD(P)-dependent dehydrogenase (short-subunit alcohol dehydrogenase family)